MLLKNLGQAHKFRNEAGEGEGGSGGSVDVLADPAVQKLLKEKIDAEVSGLKTKNKELLDKMSKAQEVVKQFEGLDVERLKVLQKQMDQNEEMRLLAEGKTEEVFTKRVELLKKDYEAQLSSLGNKLSEYEKTINVKEENLRKLLIDGTVREAYLGLDLEPAAIDDVIRNARDVFVMNEEGKVVPRDADGNIIFSKDGKSPIDAKGWLELQIERKPYLRRPSKGAGTNGNNGSGKNVDNASSLGKITQGLKDMGIY